MTKNLLLSTVEVTGALAERRTANGKRRLKLNDNERSALVKTRRLERAVAMFLDLDHDWTWPEMAAELGVSTRTLRDISKSEEFMEIYNEHFAELGHDPRLRAGQAAIVDMVPIAVRQLRSLLTSPNTSGTVLMKAIERVLELNGISANKAGASDKAELTKFLKDMGVTAVTQNNVTVNLPDYDRIKEYEDVIELPASQVLHPIDIEEA